VRYASVVDVVISGVVYVLASAMIGRQNIKEERDFIVLFALDERVDELVNFMRKALRNLCYDGISLLGELLSVLSVRNDKLLFRLGERNLSLLLVLVVLGLCMLSDAFQISGHAEHLFADDVLLDPLFVQHYGVILRKFEGVEDVLRELEAPDEFDLTELLFIGFDYRNVSLEKLIVSPRNVIQGGEDILLLRVINVGLVVRHHSVLTVDVAMGLRGLPHPLHPDLFHLGLKITAPKFIDDGSESLFFVLDVVVSILDVLGVITFVIDRPYVLGGCVGVEHLA